LIVGFNYFNPMSLFGMSFVGLMLPFLIGRDSWFDAFLAFMLGLSLEDFVSFLLTVANWDLHEGVIPMLLSVMLAFSLAGMVAYLLAAMIVSSQEEVRVDDKRDEVKNPTSAL
jgi:hypothetical protein